MYSHVTLYIHQNVNTCAYCNVCITHICCKASRLELKHDNICFIKKCFKNIAWKFMLLLKNRHMYLYNIHWGLYEKCMNLISVFM